MILITSWVDQRLTQLCRQCLLRRLPLQHRRRICPMRFPRRRCPPTVSFLLTCAAVVETHTKPPSDSTPLPGSLPYPTTPRSGPVTTTHQRQKGALSPSLTAPLPSKSRTINISRQAPPRIALSSGGTSGTRVLVSPSSYIRLCSSIFARDTCLRRQGRRMGIGCCMFRSKLKGVRCFRFGRGIDFVGSLVRMFDDLGF